jgi:hypothetical protein
MSKVFIAMELGVHVNTPKGFSSETFGLLEYYAAQIGSYLKTFRDDLSVPYSRMKHFKKK